MSATDAREVNDAAVFERRGEERRMMVDRVRLGVVEVGQPRDAVAVDVVDDALVAVLIVLDDLRRQNGQSHCTHEISLDVILDQAEQRRRGSDGEEPRIEAVVEGRHEARRRDRILVEQQSEAAELCMSQSRRQARHTIVLVFAAIDGRQDR